MRNNQEELTKCMLLGHEWGCMYLTFDTFLGVLIIILLDYWPIIFGIENLFCKDMVTHLSTTNSIVHSRIACMASLWATHFRYSKLKPLLYKSPTKIKYFETIPLRILCSFQSCLWCMLQLVADFEYFDMRRLHPFLLEIFILDI